MATVMTLSVSPSSTTPQQITESEETHTSTFDDKKNGVSILATEEAASLGVPKDEKKFWFQRSKKQDPDVVATQVCTLHRSASSIQTNQLKVSVYDNPKTASDYQPRSDW